MLHSNHVYLASNMRKRESFLLTTELSTVYLDDISLYTISMEGIYMIIESGEVIFLLRSHPNDEWYDQADMLVYSVRLGKKL